MCTHARTCCEEPGAQVLSGQGQRAASVLEPVAMQGSANVERHSDAHWVITPRGLKAEVKGREAGDEGQEGHTRYRGIVSPSSVWQRGEGAKWGAR